MQMTITSTDEIITINGAPARRWEATTPKGVTINVYVSAIQMPEDAEWEELENALAPSPEPFELRRPAADLNKGVDLRYFVD